MQITHSLHSVSHPGSFYVEITVPKDFDSTLYHSLSRTPDTDTDDGSYDPHNLHSEESPDSESNTARRCDKLTHGNSSRHRYTRHVISTAAKQASQSISVNESEMAYTGEPRTASEAGFSSPYICVNFSQTCDVAKE